MLLKYTPGISFGVEADKNRLLAGSVLHQRVYMYFCIARIWGMPYGTGTDRKFK